ncbi:hypothetical protein RBU07_14780 [Pseudomonas aeruginosa]|nr:hypothetical protein [Pseudomonas aeruginosa]
MKHPILHHLLLGALLACADAALAERYPLSVRSCEREVTFERAPSRAVSHDINLTEMMVALGLQTRMVGYTGISGWWKNADPGLIAALKPLPELVARYPTAETLLDVDADFFFAGWGYGMRVGGDLTPASLEPLGVKVYELSESCAQIGEPRRASLDELYRDLRNLGRIFDVEPRAEAAGSLEEALDEADVILLCTSSARAVIDPRQLKRPALVTSISTNAPRAHEVPAESLAAMDVYCDYRHTTPGSAGEMLIAAEQHGWSPEAIRGDLAELLSGQAPRPEYRRPAFFRSIGLGLEDVALANALYRLRQAG